VRAPLPSSGGTAVATEVLCSGTTPNEIKVIDAPRADFDPSLPETQAFVWQSSTDGARWFDIPGADRARYTPDPLTASTQFRRVIRDSLCLPEVASDPVQKQVAALTAGALRASTSTACASGGATLEITEAVAPSGNLGTVRFQWQERSAGGAWANINGATASKFNAPASVAGQRDYRRLASDDCSRAAPVATDPVTLTVNASPTGGTITPETQQVCLGIRPSILNNAVQPTGTGPLSYTWEKKVGDGAWGVIANEAQATYWPPAGSAAASPLPTGGKVITTYRRKATYAGCGSAFSNSATVTELAPPCSPDGTFGIP
jgi:hypothetical protein